MTRLWRTFGGARFELSGRPELLACARRWLGSQGWRRGAAPPGAVRISLRRARGGLEWRAGALGAPRGEQEAGLAELESRCVAKALAVGRYAAALHAALVVDGGRACLLLGRHGHGKTTLALALRARGLRVLEDDVVLLDARGRARPLARPLRVRLRPGRGPELLPPRVRARSVVDATAGVRYVDSALLGEGRPGRFAPTHVVFLEYLPGRPTRLAPLAAAAAVPLALRHTFSVRPRDGRVAAAVVALCGRARAWRLRHGEAPTTTAGRLLDEALGGSG